MSPCSHAGVLCTWWNDTSCSNFAVAVVFYVWIIRMWRKFVSLVSSVPWHCALSAPIFSLEHVNYNAGDMGHMVWFVLVEGIREADEYNQSYHIKQKWCHGGQQTAQTTWGATLTRLQRTQQFTEAAIQSFWVIKLNSYSASHDNWCTATLWNRIMTVQCEGMGEVGSARYEPALLPPCPSIRALSYSNCPRSTHSNIRAWQCKC